MKSLLWVLIITLLTCIISSLVADNSQIILVFYKEREPSQRVLERVIELLESYKDEYSIEYLNIDNEQNIGIITELELPATHFPFALAINGKFTANFEERTVSFVHFPLFMKGIGRHEGNWSLDDLRRVLDDNSFLAEENILPVINDEEETTECEDD